MGGDDWSMGSSYERPESVRKGKAGGISLHFFLCGEASPLAAVSFPWFHYDTLAFVGPWALITLPSPFVSQPRNVNGLLPLLVLRTPHCPFFGFSTIPSSI